MSGVGEMVSERVERVMRIFASNRCGHERITNQSEELFRDLHNEGLM